MKLLAFIFDTRNAYMFFGFVSSHAGFKWFRIRVLWILFAPSTSKVRCFRTCHAWTHSILFARSPGFLSARSDTIFSILLQALSPVRDKTYWFHALQASEETKIHFLYEFQASQTARVFSCYDFKLAERQQLVCKRLKCCFGASSKKAQRKYIH